MHMLKLTIPLAAAIVDTEALLVLRFPATGQLCLLTEDEHRLSCAVPGYKLEPNETIINSYSENAGVLEGLLATGAVELTGRVVQSGYVEMAVVRVIHPDFDPNALLL